MKICILGGGLAGFSTAAALTKYATYSTHPVEVALIHNPKVKALSVGESTQLPINRLFEYLELSDFDWMKECDATYKCGVKFEDFNYGTEYFFPLFHRPTFDKDMKDENVRGYFLGRDTQGITPDLSSFYFSNEQASWLEKNKLDDSVNTAYHFNATKLSNYLENFARKKGLKVFEDSFRDTVKDAQGYIRALICEGQTYFADLFIDCTGFKSLLASDQKWVPYDTLLNRKVLTASIPYENKDIELKNYTTSTALRHGWCWDIPLWTHRSVGYVHSNKFASDVLIEAEFRDMFGERETHTIAFDSGRWEKAWVKNVVSMGAAYGFTEPLEATNISAIVSSINALTEAISKRDGNITTIDRDLYNYKIAGALDNYRFFIELHYIFALRSDSQYWRHICNDINWRYETNIKFSYDQLFRQLADDRVFYDYGEQLGALFIAAGQDYSCLAKDQLTHPRTIGDSNYQFDKKSLLDLKAWTEKQIANKPSSYQYLKNTIYK
tara:strand:+ start:649 stop:2136 length:1488 start_codon:yes stop_codon:yes gene_type:complete